MDDQQSNQRLLVAGALCLAVLLGWQVVFPPPPPPEGAAQADAGAVATATAAVARDGNGHANSHGAATATVARAPRTAAVKAQEFTYAGEVSYEDTEVPYRLVFTNIGGGIQDFVLPGYKERDQDNQATEQPIRLANPMNDDPEDRTAAFGQMAGLSFLDGTTFETSPRLPFEVVEQNEERLHLRHTTPEGVVIEREYQMRPDSFEIEMAVTVRNTSQKRQSYKMQLHSALQVTEAMKRGGGFFSNFIPPADHLQGLCHTDGEVEREDYSALAEETEKFSDRVRWVAADRQYFVSAIVTRDREEVACRLITEGEVTQAALRMPEHSLGASEEKRYKFTAFLGPKKPAVLTLVEADLEGTIDYKFIGLNLAPLCAGLLWLLGVLHGVFGSWGWAILGLTVIVKLVLFPLNQRQGKSMRAMMALKPQLEAIKEKYADDRQRQGEETWKLYREHNVNPTGGCLPMLIQMPIWIALYRSLWSSVDLYQEPFLWIGDLTTRDPFWILPITLVVVMFLQQKMMPTAMDPAQQKMMMYTMPLMFGAMMSALPAGLCFYILVNTLLTIIQQHFINRSIGPRGGSPAAPEAKA